MIKKTSLKKITIASMALIILLITYMFPTTLASNNINQTLSYVEPNKATIFLLDESEMVSRTKTITDKSSDIYVKAKNIINALTIDSEKSKYNPSGFKALIPKGTVINSIDLNDKVLKINFSKEFLNVDDASFEKMIESLIFSLTEMDEIDKIAIFIDNELLTKIPNSSKTLPSTLDRSFGINKVYELDNLKDTMNTTIYYLNDNDGNKYYTPVTFITNDKKDKIEVIIEKLKSSPTVQTNLMSYLASNAELLDYEITESSVDLTFNNYIFNEFSDKDILEEVKYTIGLSIFDNYDVKKVNFNVNDEKITTFDINTLE